MSGSTMTFTQDMGHDNSDVISGVRMLIVDWTSDSVTGSVSATTGFAIKGRLVKATTVPGAGGVQPTNDYTVTITDQNGVNVLANCDRTLAGNQSNSAAQETYFFELNHAGTPAAMPVHPIVCDELTIAVSAAGNSKQGTMYLYYEPLK